MSAFGGPKADIDGLGQEILEPAVGYLTKPFSAASLAPSYGGRRQGSCENWGSPGTRFALRNPVRAKQENECGFGR
jgi:hypothetical protein